MGDHSKQWECIKKWVNRKKSGKRAGSGSVYDPDEEENNEISNIRHTFRLPTALELVTVCKEMFLKTFGIL